MSQSDHFHSVQDNRSNRNNQVVPAQVASESKSRTRQITVLNDDNFGVWKWNLKYNLKTLGVYECVTNPDQGTQAQKDEAMLEIISSIDDKIKQRVSYCKDPYTLYTDIEKLYTNKTSFQATSLHMQLTNFKFKSAQHIPDGIGVIQNLIARIKNLGESISDHMIEGIVLAALPSSFRTFVSVWKGVPASERTLTNLYARIMAEVEDNRLFNLRDDKALFVNNKKFPRRSSGSKSNKSSSGSNDKPKKFCRYCKKPNHVIEECHRLKQKKREEAAGHHKPGSSKESDRAMVATVHPIIDWIADSGASSHMTNRRDWFINFEKFKNPLEILIADNSTILAYGSGSIKTTVGTMQEVLFMPDLSSNLFSITAATRFNINVHYSNESVTLTDYQGKVIIKGERRDGLYILEFEIIAPENECVFVARPITEWHRCLGHVSDKVIKRMAETGAVDGLEISNKESYNCCEDCAINKGHAVPHRDRSTQRAIKPGSSLHLDTVGPMQTPSLNGSKYFVLCKDEASAYRKVLFMECKSEIPFAVKQLITQAKFDTGNDVVKICTDNGSEYVNHKLQDYFKEHGVAHVTSSPYVPQQNGYIERDIRTIVESARTMLNSAQLPEELWAESVNTAVYIMNRVPTTSNPTTTPYKLWFGTKPNIKNLRVFGQRAVVNKPLVYRQGKWDTTGEVLRLVGYSNRINTYRFYNQEKDRIILSCNVTFLNDDLQPEFQFDDIQPTTKVHTMTKSSRVTYADVYGSDDDVDQPNTTETVVTINDSEDSSGSSTVVGSSSSQGVPLSSPQRQSPSSSPQSSKNSRQSTSSEIEPQSNLQPGQPINQNAQPHNQVEISKEPSKGSSIMPNRSSILPGNIPKNLHIGIRKPRPPVIQENRLRDRTKLNQARQQSVAPEAPAKRSSLPNKASQVSNNKGHALLLQDAKVDDPLTFKEAVGRPDAQQWQAAMKDELSSLAKNNVWDLVPRPKGTNIVTNRWVYKLKRKPSGEIDRYRARLVARGFSQVEGIDYSETYAPVANMPTVRLLLAFAAVKQLKFRQFDIKTAFLYGNLEETVYMDQPEGHQDGTNRVCLLKKSLYGLKQAPRQWNKEFSNFLQGLKLEVSTHDRCVYYRTKPSILIIVIYVDDGLIFAQNLDEINIILKELHERFEVHEADSTVFLGFQINQSKKSHSLFIHQDAYVKRMLEKFNMTSSKPVDTPSTLTKPSEEMALKPLEENIPYREAVGSLMYAANTVRLDVAYAVNRAARRVSEPSQQDWLNVKRIFRYLSDKSDIGITYNVGDNLDLYAYCDADFAGDPSYHSTTGFVIMFGGGPIHWKCQKQPLVALSSTEAELISLCALVQQLVWIRNLALELNIINMGPTTIFCDNQSAIRLAIDEGSVHRTRHMGARAAFTRSMIEEKNIKVEHISTDEQGADFLTKSLSSAKFIFNRGLLMMMALLFIVAGSANSMTFEATSPIIWLPTNNYVDAGVVEYDLIWTVLNPCAGLKKHQSSLIDNRIHKRQIMQPIQPQVMQPMQQPPQPMQTGPQPMQQSQPIMPQIIQQAPQLIPVSQEESTESQIEGYIVQECNQMWTNVFIQSFKDLKNRIPIFRKSKPSINIDTKRGKRSIIDAVETTAELVAAGCVTNLISAAVSYFNPHSDRNRINSLEERQKMTEDAAIDFEERFNLTQEIQHGILGDLMGLNLRQRELQNQIHHLAFLMPRVSWMSAYIQQKITTASINLRNMIDEYLHGRVACKEVSTLLGLEAIKDIDNHDTRFEFIEQLSANRMHLKFIIRKRSQDTQVYKVFAFRYWDKLTDIPTLMEYRGYNTLIYNETANCLKAIEDPTQSSFTDDVCIERNYSDPRLSIWEKLVETRDIYKFNTTCQTKKTMDFNYIYCFPFNVTTKMGTFTNPPHVYRLPVMEAFELPITKYTPVIRKLNISGPFDFPAIDSTHMSQFPMGSEVLNGIKWFDKLQHLMQLNERLVHDKQNSYTIEKQGGTFWSFSIFVFVLICITGGLITYNIRLSRDSARRHQRIASDIMEMKQDYCSVIKAPCSNCQPSASTSTGAQRSQPKTRVNVGNNHSINESVTVNFGRQLPKPPRKDDQISLG